MEKKTLKVTRFAYTDGFFNTRAGISAQFSWRNKETTAISLANFNDFEYNHLRAHNLSWGRGAKVFVIWNPPTKTLNLHFTLQCGPIRKGSERREGELRTPPPPHPLVRHWIQHGIQQYFCSDNTDHTGNFYTLQGLFPTFLSCGKAATSWTRGKPTLGRV